MTRKKTTVYLDEELLKAVKIMAARKGWREYQVVEEALRRYLGLELLDRLGELSDLSEEEALKLAYDELHAGRR